MTETVSWFMAAGEFFSKLANTFVHLVSCIRIRDECAAELAAYQSRINCLTTMENRDSMGLLAAVFTGLSLIDHHLALYFIFRRRSKLPD